MQKMSKYPNYLKDITTRRKKIGEFETATVTEGYMAILHNKASPKRKDPGSFTIPYTIGNQFVGEALYDLGASINLMRKSIFQKVGIRKA